MSVDEKQINTDAQDDNTQSADDSLQQDTQAQNDLQTQQVDIDAAIERRLARERAIQERRLKKLFGTKSLDEAAQLAEAGRVVSSAANVPPQTVVDRVRSQYQSHFSSGGNVPSGDLQRELSEIRRLIADEREEKVMAQQVAEVQKEFGTLFDEYREEIELVAEDKGLTLIDAAAVTLRPYLKKHYEQRIQARRQVAAQRKVDDSGDAPSTAIDVDAQLTPSQKRVAKRMGLTNQEYYNQLKELGKIR